MLSQDSFDSVHSSVPSVTEEEMEDEDDAMELLGNLDVLTLYTHTHANWIRVNYAVQCLLKFMSVNENDSTELSLCNLY